MRIVEESWNVLVTLLPTGWQQMAWRLGAVQRLRGFPSPDVLLRVLMLHVARCGAVGPHELILADAGYCSIAGIEYVWQHGADALVRVNPQSFMAYSAHGRRFSLLPRLRTLSKVGQVGEWQVVLHGQASAFAGRLCALRKSDCAVQQAHRRLLRNASKKQMINSPGTLELAKYVIVFTTRSSGSTADVLRSYRMRWQIEMAFKRLKSLAQLGHLPKHDDRSSRASLYGKLLVTLLAEKLIRIGRDISPSGYSLSERTTM
jgi:hypothetical protein